MDLEQQGQHDLRASSSVRETPRPSRDDMSTFSQVVSRAPSLSAEQFEQDVYLDNVISKPWGHEYRVYADLFYDVWKLCLSAGERTSVHCHPRKETALLCLSGHGKVRLLDREYSIEPLSVIWFRKGVFHSTENVGNTPLELVEVETPRNKLDLVRVQDRYGRQGRSYETATGEGELCGFNQLSQPLNAKLRRTSMFDRYAFDVVSGAQLPARGAMFVVSLSLDNAFQQQLAIASAAHERAVDIESAAPYLVISRPSEI
jgi:mannose-6-phosphate isomerase-like protein (cupin superfamily)